MDFLKRFDLELYNLYLAIQDDMGTHPLYAVSKAQLFVGKLHDKLEGQSDAFLAAFEADLSWLMGLRRDVALDEALKAHEMLYRMSCWAVQTLEAPEALPPYPASKAPEGFMTEADVLGLIEKKVLVTLCGIIKEMDTVMAALDEVERKNADLEARVRELEQQPDFRGMLKSLPRTKG